jgi:hypothetical protein
MKYQCIRCFKTWGEASGDDPFFSHGLCAACLKEALIPLYRKRQTEEGNFDCFGKASGFCDQQACKYRTVCLEPS